MNTIKTILAGVALSAAVTLAPPAMAQGDVKVNAQQTARDFTWAKYSISGPYAGVPLSITNGAVKLVTNALFKVPANTAVTFSPLFLAGTSNVTCFVYPSFTGTNADDFATIPLLARAPGTSAAARPWTNFTSAVLGGARWLKWGAISNDAGAGLTEVTITPSNGVFSAHGNF